MDLANIDLKKGVLILLALAGTIFTFGGIARDYRQLPSKVTNNTDAIQANTQAIESTNGKLDSVLCLLVQDQVTPEGEPLNPLLCLRPGEVPEAFSPFPPMMGAGGTGSGSAANE